MGRAEPVRDGKYARVERERRFLLARPPPPTAGGPARQITDRYLTGTRLRLRLVEHLDSGTSEFKLTQKVPAGRPGPVQGLITNFYLSAAEYDVLASLPGAVLRKTRVGAQALVFDIFAAPLDGLVLAESEFGSDDEAAGFSPACAVVAEVTDDPRFTGGRLAVTQRGELLGWLAEFGVTLAADGADR